MMHENMFTTLLFYFLSGYILSMIFNTKNVLKNGSSREPVSVLLKLFNIKTLSQAFHPWMPKVPCASIVLKDHLVFDKLQSHKLPCDISLERWCKNAIYNEKHRIYHKYKVFLLLTVTYDYNNCFTFLLEFHSWKKACSYWWRRIWLKYIKLWWTWADWNCWYCRW